MLLISLSHVRTAALPRKVTILRGRSREQHLVENKYIEQLKISQLSSCDTHETYRGRKTLTVKNICDYCSHLL